MANGKQSSLKRMKMSERAQQQMQILFPGVGGPWVWHRKTNDGFITVPRTLPIVMQAIDNQSKGQPAGHTLLSLWMRAPDHALMTIEHPATYAAEAGFVGERAVDTWRRRMKRLRELGMIVTKPGASGEFHYVLLVNPNAAMELMRHRGQVLDEVYSRFVARVGDIGAYAEIEAVQAWVKAEQEKQAAAAKAEAAKAAAPPPPPPPAASLPTTSAPEAPVTPTT